MSLTAAAALAPVTSLVTGAVDPLLPDLFVMDVSVAEKIVRTVLVYLGIAILIRVAGKRLMAQMNNLDLVVVLLLSNVVQNAIIGNDVTLTGGLIGATVLVLVNAVLDRWADRSPRVRWLLEGTPTSLVRDGAVIDTDLRRLGITRTELREALRQQGAEDVSEVAFAEIEPGGSIHVDLRPEDRGVSRAEFEAAVERLSALITAERR